MMWDFGTCLTCMVMGIFDAKIASRNCLENGFTMYHLNCGIRNVSDLVRVIYVLTSRINGLVSLTQKLQIETAH